MHGALAMCQVLASDVMCITTFASWNGPMRQVPRSSHFIDEGIELREVK